MSKGKKYHSVSQELPVGLEQRILELIRAEERTALRKEIFLVSIGLLGSALAFFPLLQVARTGFVQSGFWELFSLLFSDVAAVTGYWQNFVFALLEALPAASMAALLVTFLVLWGSLQFLAHHIRLIIQPDVNRRGL